MTESETLPNQALRFRVAELEARVDRLEQALAALVAPKDGKPLPTKTQKLVTITMAERGLKDTAPMATLEGPGGGNSPVIPASAPVPPPAAKAAPPPAAKPAPPPAAKPAPPPAPVRTPTDSLGITDAFATLDLTLAQAHQSESALPRRTQRGADLDDIDEAIVDRHLERPPPEKLDVRSALEEGFPKILKRVMETWRTQELRTYLSKLIVDDRGDRAGFDPNVMSELLMLNAVLDAVPDAGAWTGQAPVA